jgi:ABC-type transport system involved in multi-copper enzyme maturation permease subunit
MSPIHDQSYRRYQGHRHPPGRGWAVIAAAGLRAMLGRKPFLALVLLAWAPFIVRSVIMYGTAMSPMVGQLAPTNVKMFQDFIEQQGIFVFFVTIYVGAGLIANDRRANALQIYLSKPMLRTEYIFGKLLILMVYVAEVTLLPGLLLVVMQIMFAGSFDFVRANTFVILSVFLASMLRVLVCAFTMLALSSLSKSTRYVAVLYTGAIFFTEAMYVVLRQVTGSSRVAWVSITRNIEQVTDVIFRRTPRYDTPTVVCVLVLLGLLAISLSVLERRVRGVEVVR